MRAYPNRARALALGIMPREAPPLGPPASAPRYPWIALAVDLAGALALALGALALLLIPGP